MHFMELPTKVEAATVTLSKTPEEATKDIMHDQWGKD